MTEAIELGCEFQSDLVNYDDKPRDYHSEPAKIKYTQNWSAYNLSQCKEKLLALKILSSIVDEIGVKTYGIKKGRPPALMTDMIKCNVIRVFNNFSARRTTPELELAYQLKYISTRPHFNTVIKYMNNPSITHLLRKIIVKSSIPLAGFEKRFAIDSTGFSTFNRDRWIKVRLEHQLHRDYKKLHAVCGVSSNIIVAAKVTHGKAHDSPHFKGLIKEISRYFKIREVSADGAYASRDNVRFLDNKGIKPFFKLRKDTVRKAKGCMPWKKMVMYFKKNKASYLKHYHLRSNSETTFAMIKRKFHPYVRSKLAVSQENEILMKCTCHNLSVLVSAVFELNVDLKYLD